MVTFKRLVNKKIVLKNGPGPYSYRKDGTAKWKDYSATVSNRADAKNRASKQTWGYEYHSSLAYFQHNLISRLEKI